MEVDNLEQLSSRIIHDHMRFYEHEEVKDDDGPRVINLLKPQSESSKQRREKERRLKLYQEVKHLYYDEEVPMKYIARRLGLSYYKIRKAINSNDTNIDNIFEREKKPITFKKLH